MSRTPLVNLHDVHVRLAGRDVLTGVDWQVVAGELVALLGPNGAGKTTLLRTMLGLIPAHRGTVRIQESPPQSARRLIGYVPQKHQFAWDFPLTVEETVLSGRIPVMGFLKRPGVRDWKAVRRAVERAGLSELRNRPLGELSGGQRQRVLLARALATDPQVLLLDEPFTGVDVPTQQMLSELYRGLAEEGRALVMSTHDLPGALEVCTRVCGLRGEIVVDEKPERLSVEQLHHWLRGSDVALRRQAA